jgi:hypothetical protein
VAPLQKKISDIEGLSQEDFVQYFDAELSPLPEEIRDVRRGAIDLMGQQRYSKASVFYAAEHLDPNPFMKLRKIHWARN